MLSMVKGPGMIEGTVKWKKLEELYRLHDDFLCSSESACRQGCSTCCTRNVTLTSLEGSYLLENLDERLKQSTLRRILEHLDRPRLSPLLTVNAMAQRCVNGEDLPEEAFDPAWTPCPLLDEGSCTVYPFRPLACRAMVSKSVCGTSGEADMDDALFTLNNVFMQVLEHMDQGGTYTNMMDMLHYLSEEGHLDHYKINGVPKNSPKGFLENKPLTFLMIPPEHRTMMKPVIEALQDL